MEDKANIRVKKVEKRDNYSFNFEMEINDEVGSSVAKGVIVPSENGQDLDMMFEKTYNNRSDAGQTGSFTILYYKGKKERDTFKGTWAYKDHENSTAYTGPWTMFNE